MSEPKRRERAAIEAVATKFSGTWEKGKRPACAYIVVAGERIAVDIIAMPPRIAVLTSDVKPRLRFDKVALRFVADLRVALDGSVPDGKTVVITITAPIRLASKTAEIAEERIRRHLAGRSARSLLRATIHGNRIQLRLVNRRPGKTKVVVFVHNPYRRHAGILSNIACSLIEQMGAAAVSRAASKLACDRWLIIASADESSHIEIYRHVYSQLFAETSFSKILIVFASGQIESLSA